MDRERKTSHHQCLAEAEKGGAYAPIYRRRGAPGREDLEISRAISAGDQRSLTANGGHGVAQVRQYGSLSRSDSQADNADSSPSPAAPPHGSGKMGTVDKFVNAEGPAAEGPYRCPCCGFITLTERSADEICRVCFWEDDGQDDHDADEVRGGPSRALSLTVARSNFQAMGACDERCTRFVRPPLSTELPKSSSP